MEKKNKSLKSKFASIILSSVLFLLILFLSFSFYFLINYHLYNIKLLNGAFSLLLTIIFSLLTTIFLFIILNKKENKFTFFIKNNFDRIILAIIIIMIFLISIRYELLWTSEEIKDVLTITWTIFGLSITIFLVWNVIIVEYLQKNKPKKIESNDYYEKYENLLNKREFFNNTKSIFSTVILLSINI